MAKQLWRGLFGGFLAGAAAASGWWLYSHRSRERIPSIEGIDDPAAARAYGRIAAMPQMALLRGFVARRAVAMQPAGQAADIGCGPGLLVVELVRQAPGLRVTGVDLSDAMLAQGQAHADRAGVGDRAAFRKGDAGQIPFPDGSLDLVVSTLSLHHWRDPVVVLNEVARVLRPGGAFLIFDLRRDLAAPLYLFFWFVTHVVVPRALRHVGEPLGSRNAAYTPAEAAQLAAASRLTERSLALCWRITGGPFWLTIEGNSRPSHSPKNDSRVIIRRCGGAQGYAGSTRFVD